MYKMKDLSGQKFGMLTVLRFHSKVNGTHTLWLCQCDCGNEKIVRRASLQNGDAKSCGCNRIEAVRQANKLRFSDNSYVKYPELAQIYKNMRARCLNSKSRMYPHYGGRGIEICKRWLESYENFYHDMIKSYKKELSLERIDVNGNYCPENCTWIPKSHQSRNMRTTKLNEEKVEIIRNSSKSNKELALEFNCSTDTIIDVKKEHTWKNLVIN